MEQPVRALRALKTGLPFELGDDRGVERFPFQKSSELRRSRHFSDRGTKIGTNNHNKLGEKDPSEFCPLPLSTLCKTAKPQNRVASSFRRSAAGSQTTSFSPGRAKQSSRASFQTHTSQSSVLFISQFIPFWGGNRMDTRALFAGGSSHVLGENTSRFPQKDMRLRGCPGPPRNARPKTGTAPTDAKLRTGLTLSRHMCHVSR